jgi:hypothetical protein
LAANVHGLHCGRCTERKTIGVSRNINFLLILLGLVTAPLQATPSQCDGVAGNVVANCGFETGGFTGWVESGNSGFNSVLSIFDGFDGLDPNSGLHFAVLGPVLSEGYLTQTFSTIPGATYRLNFYLGSDGATPNNFSAAWDGAAIFSQADIPSTGGGYLPSSFLETASGVTTTLTFGFRNDPGWLALDDVSVARNIPEPTSVMVMLTALAGLAILSKGFAPSKEENSEQKGVPRADFNK